MFDDSQKEEASNSVNVFESMSPCDSYSRSSGILAQPITLVEVNYTHVHVVKAVENDVSAGCDVYRLLVGGRKKSCQQGSSAFTTGSQKPGYLDMA